MTYTLLALLLLSPMELLLTPPSKVEPVICFDYLEYDYGRIPQKSCGECCFYFTNCGDAVLNIDYVKTTCGCTVAHLSKRSYEPGERGFIKVEYDTRKLGKIGKIIFVSSNSRGHEKSILRIKGEVVRLKTGTKENTKSFFDKVLARIMRQWNRLMES